MKRGTKIQIHRSLAAMLLWLAMVCPLIACDSGSEYPEDDAFESGYASGEAPDDPDLQDAYEEGQFYADCDYWKRNDYSKFVANDCPDD